LAPLPPRLAAGGILAAAAALVFGIVLGPEAPLVAIGLALGTVAARLARQNQVISSIITFAGGFAAISTVFGGPLTSSLLLFEAVAASGKFASAMLPRFLLPGLLAAGVGQLVFTGVAGWSGVHETALDLPNLPHYGSVRVVDIPLSILVALVVADAISIGAGFRGGPVFPSRLPGRGNGRAGQRHVRRLLDHGGGRGRRGRRDCGGASHAVHRRAPGLAPRQPQPQDPSDKDAQPNRA